MIPESLIRPSLDEFIEQANTRRVISIHARLLADDAAADWLFLLPNITVASAKISGVQNNRVSLAFDLTTLASRD